MFQTEILPIHDQHCLQELTNDTLNYGWIQPVYWWAQGKSFREIQEQGHYYEGNFIRCILKINNMIQELIEVYQTIGQPEYLPTIMQITPLIMRDLVSVSSLYL